MLRVASPLDWRNQRPVSSTATASTVTARIEMNLDSMERALQQLRPQTRDQVGEFDDMRVAIMATRSRYRPQDPDQCGACRIGRR